LSNNGENLAENAANKINVGYIDYRDGVTFNWIFQFSRSKLKRKYIGEINFGSNSN